MEKHSPPDKELILLGKWTSEKLDAILHESFKINDAGLRIDYLSKQFLGTPYKELSLIGDINTPEVFVINLEGVDCFTLLDYVESMRRSFSFNEFRENLRKVRYRGRDVNFKSRNHFFTDWRQFNSNFIDDVTVQIGGTKVRSIMKLLNQREDGSYYLPGIQLKDRLITHLPVDMIDDAILRELRTGDYIGIYSEKQGLDVSHVGIFIKRENDIFLRHASSLKEYRKVVDQDFRDYLTDKPGILVFRSRNSNLSGITMPE